MLFNSFEFLFLFLPATWGVWRVLCRMRAGIERLRRETDGWNVFYPGMDSRRSQDGSAGKD